MKTQPVRELLKPLPSGQLMPQLTPLFEILSNLRGTFAHSRAQFLAIQALYQARSPSI